MTEVVNLPDVLNCFNLTVVLSFFLFFFLSLIPIHDARFNVRSEYGYFDDFRQVTNMCLKRSIRIDIREIKLMESYFEISNYYCKYFEGLFKNSNKTIVL